MIDEKLDDQRELIEPLILACLREIFHHIPKNHAFTLPNGIIGTTRTFYEPKQNSETGEYSFGIDVIIEGFPVDHIEFTMKNTGHGGFVGALVS